jgi:hypothetical protein
LRHGHTVAAMPAAKKNPPGVNRRHLLIVWMRLKLRQPAETGPMAAAYLDLNLLFAKPTKGRRRSIGEMKHRLFLIAVGSSIVASMTGWLYALGWVALKLIQFV